MCEARDVKGLYKKARDGLISGFTGVSQDYEAPQNPDLAVTTVNQSIQESTHRVIDLLEQENIIPRNLRDVEIVRTNFALIYHFSVLTITRKKNHSFSLDSGVICFAKPKGGGDWRIKIVAIFGDINR